MQRSSRPFQVLARAEWVDDVRAVAPKLVGTLGTSGVVVALGVVTGVLAARGLGPVARGDLARLLLWPQLISTLGTVGIDLATTYFSSHGRDSRDVPATALRLAWRQSALLVAVYLALVPVLFRGHVTWAAFVVAVEIPADLVALYSTGSLNGRLEYRAFNGMRIVMSGGYALGLLLLVGAGRLTSGSAAISFVVANATVAVVSLAILKRRHGLGTPNVLLRREMVRYGLAGHVGRLSPQTLGVDVVIIALVLSSRDLGLYVAAAALMAAPALIAASVGLVVFPQASAAHRAGRPLGVRGPILASVAATVVVAAAMWVLAGPMLTLFFGHEFRAGTQVVRWLALGEICRSTLALLASALRGAGRPGVTSAASVVSWAAFMIAVPVGAALGGLVGVAIAVAVANASSLAGLAALSAQGRGLRLVFGRSVPTGAVGEPG